MVRLLLDLHCGGGEGKQKEGMEGIDSANMAISQLL